LVRKSHFGITLKFLRREFKYQGVHTLRRYGAPGCMSVINVRYLIKRVRHADHIKRAVWGADAMHHIRHWLKITVGAGNTWGIILDGDEMERFQG